MQRECKFCDNHQTVNMEKPEGSDKWIVTNLDGSFHKHVKYGGNQPSQQHVTISDTVVRKESPEVKEAWNKAHEENMNAAENQVQAMNELKETINSLGDGILDTKFELHEINNNLKALTSIVTAYLETFKK